MKRCLSIIKLFFIVSICSLFLSCSTKENKSVLPEPKIEFGVAKIEGKVIGLNVDKNFTLTIQVYNPITIDILTKEVLADENGEFSLEIPVEIDPSVGVVTSNLSNDIFSINFSTEEKTVFDYVIDEYSGVTLNVKEGPRFLVENTKYVTNLFVQSAGGSKTSVFVNKDSIAHFVNNPKSFIPFLIEYDLDERLKLFETDTRISEQSKFYYMNEIKLMTAEMSFLKYVENITNLYNSIKKEGDTTIVVKQPDKSYYTFLKEFELGNPYYLYNFYYPSTLQSILQDENLKIPPINDIPVNEWLKSVKEILDGLIEENSGIFYDMLISNAYARQLSYSQIPLSDEQIRNIKEYFEDGGIAKILLRKNEEILKIVELKEKTIFNDTPKVSKEELLKTIVDKYRGKVVLVDLWATWCGPCLNAMKEMQPLKGELKGDDMVFVYLTNTSSPLVLWTEKAKGIGGEHYYLTDIEWDYILDQLEVESIPTYLMFDKQSNLKNKMVGYHGTEEMRRLLKEELK